MSEGVTCSPEIVVTPGETVTDRTDTAAPRIFKLPAPPPANPASAMNELVTCSATFTSIGESFGRPSRSNAVAPLTTAVDMLVPDSWIYAPAPLPATCRSGYVAARYDPAASAETMWLPGATRSGLRIVSYSVGPFELYVA